MSLELEMNKEKHWLQRDKKKTPKEEGEAAMEYINELKEEAKTKEEAENREQKPKSVREKQYKDD